jgi:hypothetical protein
MCASVMLEVPCLKLMRAGLLLDFHAESFGKKIQFIFFWEKSYLISWQFFLDFEITKEAWNRA